MITLSSLVSEYGHNVDKGLITSIWNEQHQDKARCREIVRMLSDHPSESSTTAGANSIGTASVGESESLSLSSSRTETSTSSSSRSKPANLADDVKAITSPQVLVDFLAACFPECGDDYLNTKVKEIFCTGDREFQVDPIEAIDIISNAVYNDNEAVETQQYQQSHNVSTKQPAKKDASSSLEAIAAQYSVSGSTSKSKNKRRNKGKTKNKSLAAVARRSSVQLESGGNAWTAIDTELNSLCSIFPMLSLSTVRSAYHACGAHIDKTVERLSEIAESHAKPPNATLQPAAKEDLHRSAVDTLTPMQQTQKKKTIDVLKMLFADAPKSLLEQAATEMHDVDAAAERVLVLIDEEEKAAALAAQSNAKNKKSSKWKPAEDLANYHIAPTSSPATAENEPQIYDVTQRVPLSEISGDARVWIANNPRDADYCRKRANAYISKRNELYAKATHAYARRNNLHHSGATALYYSTEGHKYDAQARIWRMRAAQASVAEMKRRDANIVDLHGLTRSEAIAVTRDALAAWHKDARPAKASSGIRPLHIVTGLGNHSIGGRACIHPSILRLLREGGWKFEQGDGYIDVLDAGKGRQLSN
ncbi:hypothetical protein IWW36_001353 [Coemansia brasiliensis]|uniref:Smr domain-containing protein n=1 Tax=Coemansia brasiliensis TaxID=2650707 RepID=A0A9W8M0F1_9FUNG|nr:hypothetical protein IWW36_001353 [Coemansia brasiliensis]